MYSVHQEEMNNADIQPSFSCLSFCVVGGNR